MSYSVTEIVGKTLNAKKAVDIRSRADDSAPLIATIQPGNYVGVVYSYVIGANNVIWWMLEDGYNFVKHETGAFDEEFLIDQGTLSTLELQRKKQLDESSFFEKMFLKAQWAIEDSKSLKIAFYIVLFALVGFVILKLYKSSGVKLSKSLPKN